MSKQRKDTDTKSFCRGVTNQIPLGWKTRCVSSAERSRLLRAPPKMTPLGEHGEPNEGQRFL